MGALETVILTIGAALLATGLSVAFTAASAGAIAAGWVMAVVGVLLIALNVVIALRARRHVPPPTEDPGPKLVAEAGWLQKIIEGNRDPALIATLFLTNVPKGPRSGTARIVAHINYVDRQNRELNLVGRWGDDKLPDHQDRAVQPIEIAPGVTRSLDLAINFFGSDEWYALDNQSPFHGYRESSHILLPTVVMIVRLVGNVDQRFVVWFRGEGKGAHSINSQPALPP